MARTPEGAFVSRPGGFYPKPKRALVGGFLSNYEFRVWGLGKLSYKPYNYGGHDLLFGRIWLQLKGFRVVGLSTGIWALGLWELRISGECPIGFFGCSFVGFRIYGFRNSLSRLRLRLLAVQSRCLGPRSTLRWEFLPVDAAFVL